MSSKRTILVVDQDASSRFAFRALLSALDAEVTEAASAEEALLLLLEQPFDAVILDAELPTIGGFDMARLIKSRKSLAGTPIVVVGVMDDPRRRDGAPDYFRKPVDTERLLRRMSRLIGAPLTIAASPH